MADFLFEAGLEEIPARMIAAAQADLARRVFELLNRSRLLNSDPSVAAYSTPRRLAVVVKGVIAAQPELQEHLMGPSWSIAFKDGEPTAAAHAFAKKAGVEVNALTKISTGKGEYVLATTRRKGQTAAEIVAEQLPKELAALYWPKNMYWRAGKPERFVRPVKWLLALLDREIVPLEFAGVRAANLTYGHRVLYGERSIAVEQAGDYPGVLESAYVIADVELRRQRIRKGLDAATRSVAGARWREDESLVDTVTNLTEWPAVLLGSFEAEYLKLPEEVLVTVMRDHQKYFAVEDAQGELARHFLAVLNTRPAERSDEIIRHGNERVLRARFNDARFFWNVDQKISLPDRVKMLGSVTFQQELGSYHDKTEANLRVAENLAKIVIERGATLDKTALFTAVCLAKADLTTELVKEFTELQGIVGGLYARAQGLEETVAQAIYWQYSPAGTTDPIPPTAEGQVLGLADRFQTIVAMFGIGLEPTGSKDPFGLRRAGNGIVKILAESDLPLALSDLEKLISSKEQLELQAKVGLFLRERVEFYLREVRGFAYDVVNAVVAVGYDNLRDASARAEALNGVRGSDDFVAVSSSFKRIRNILRQAEDKRQYVRDSNHPLKDNLLVEPSERALKERAYQIAPDFKKYCDDREYRQALELIATLRSPTDLFFDKVLVIAEDPAIRQNRLTLLAMLLGTFSSIADFSEIVTQSA